MKKTLTLLLLSAAFTSKAQITLDHTFTPTKTISSPVLFSSNGTKLLVIETTTNEVKLYNSDYTLWKTMTPPTFAGYTFNSAFIVSDNLFNSDNSIEYIANYTSSSGSKSVIVSETGSTLFDLGDANPWNVFVVDGVHKLGTYKMYSGYVTTNFYTLPGTLPCGHCGGAAGVPKTQSSGGYVSQAIPNPANGEVKIIYSLPEGVSVATFSVIAMDGKAVYSQPVSSSKNEITFNNSSLPQGVYQYVISADGMMPVTGKMVK